MIKETTTIAVGRDTAKELMLFKIQTNARNLDEILKIAISKLKEVCKNGTELSN